jgi:hypothetical protein
VLQVRGLDAIGFAIFAGLPAVARANREPEMSQPEAADKCLPHTSKPAAYEVYDFQLVAFGEVGVGPLVTRDDVAV